MANFVLITDSGCDLPAGFIESNDIATVSLVYALDDQEYFDDFGRSQDHRSFYDAMRNGAMTRTSQASASTLIDLFRSYAADGQEVLYLCLSSGLSGTYNTALLARQTVLEEYPDAGISVVDSLSASLGQGLLVKEAQRLRMEGKSREETAQWLTEHRLKLNHWFTVEDLEYLRRGGRLSALKAAVGAILNVKPILQVDDAGHLIPVSKVRGRKKSISALADEVVARGVDLAGQEIGISHADCPDDAQQLAALIQEKAQVDRVFISQIGPVIGAHAGPGTLAVFFYGQDRQA